MYDPLVFSTNVPVFLLEASVRGFDPDLSDSSASSAVPSSSASSVESAVPSSPSAAASASTPASAYKVSRRTGFPLAKSASASSNNTLRSSASRRNRRRRRRSHAAPPPHATAHAPRSAKNAAADDSPANVPRRAASSANAASAPASVTLPDASSEGAPSVELQSSASFPDAHAVRSGLGADPSAHAVQFTAPAADDIVPAGHGAHSDTTARRTTTRRGTDPASQSLCAVAPRYDSGSTYSDPTDPGEKGAHATLAFAGANVPAGHTAHVDVMRSRNVPGAHASHRRPPPETAEGAWPGRHSHRDQPASERAPEGHAAHEDPSSWKIEAEYGSEVDVSDASVDVSDASSDDASAVVASAAVSASASAASAASSSGKTEESSRY